MSGQQRGDREWEHWPEERKLDDGIRHRLRGLFHPVGHTEEVVEDFLAQHGRELESRAAQLSETIADLERREQRTTDLRIAVEQMLRRGSVELDERHAELAELAAHLAERESLAGETEKLLADRRSELGAVELRRAALERREEAIAERERSLADRAAELAERENQLSDVEQRAAELIARSTEVAAREERLTQAAEEMERDRAEYARRLAELEVREHEVARLTERAREIDRRHATITERAEALDATERAVEQQRGELRRAVEVLADTLGLTSPQQVTASSPNAEPADLSAHLLFVAGDRYRLVVANGPAPMAGAAIQLDGATYSVSRIGPSPLPADRRRCAYLDRVRPSSA